MQAEGALHAENHHDRHPTWVPWERFTLASGSADMRFPVAATTPNGRLLVAFQHRLDDGDAICITSSGPDGETWTAPQTVAQAVPGREFLTTGMGRLHSGRLILIAASRSITVGQFQPAPDRPAGVRRFHVTGFRLEATPLIYYSDDEGTTWQSGSVGPCGLPALMPCGHPVESEGGLWLLAYGPADKWETEGQLSSLVLLRSDAAVLTWRYESTIARADPDQTISYGPADLVRLPDGTLVALIEVNDRGLGPGIRPRIARAERTDGGKTWTPPVNALIGPRPSAILLPNGLILCGTADDAGVHAAVSSDGGHRWSSLQYIRSVIHYRKGRRGGIWLAEPSGDVIFGVCHWMQSDHPDRTELQGFFLRRMNAHWPPGWQDRPYQPTRMPQALTRWRRAESKIVWPDAREANSGLVYQSMTRTPTGQWLALGMGVPPEQACKDGKVIAYQDRDLDVGVFLIHAPAIAGPWETISRVPIRRQFPHLWVGMSRLKSGRIIVCSVDSNEGDVRVSFQPVGGAPRGWQWQERTYHELLAFRTGISISDDGGKTWAVHYFVDDDVRIDGKKPPCVLFDRSNVIEVDDATLVRPCQCWLTEDHQRRGLISAAVIRSRDGGVTWDDGTLIAQADPHDAVVWREPHLTVLPDSRWLVVLRVESFKWGADKRDTFTSAYVASSADHGYTWTKPYPLTVGAEAEIDLLPDATLFIGTRKYNQSYYWLSDDGGETFFLQETIYDGPELTPGREDIVGTPRPVIVDEKTLLTVTDAPGRQVMSAGPILVRYLRRRQ